MTEPLVNATRRPADATRRPAEAPFRPAHPAPSSSDVRRPAKRLVYWLLVTGLSMFLLAFLAAGCGEENPPGTSVTSGGSETTAASGATGGTAASTPRAGAPVVGGKLRVGTEPAVNRDPAFASARSDIMINQQVYDWLVEIDTSNQLLPGLAAHWESSDGRTWTFDLRTGVKFSNGSPFTAEDVVYTFDRLRDPGLGSPAAGLFGNVAEVKANGTAQVQFVLTEANPEFPSDVADYHAAILSKDVADPATEWVGTGPFLLTSYSAEDRAVLTRNPNYWQEDDEGRGLPYLDSIEFVFTPDLTGRIEALRGGQLDFVAGLTSELVDSLKNDKNLQILIGPASAFHYVIHMRSDEGRPTADVRVRQALQLGTNHQELIDQVRPGLAVVGNGTPVGPAYGDYYLDRTPTYSPEEARRLLTEAGYEDGLTITLYAQQALEVPAIATVWKAQMERIGVTVNIQTLPPDVYYGEGDSSWLVVDFGITEWGARATPNQYFNAAYLSSAPWNESHWADGEFDTVATQINSELDRAARIQLYHRAQEILIERGPVIVPFFSTAAAGANAALRDVQLAPDWSRTLFRTAYFAE